MIKLNFLMASFYQFSDPSKYNVPIDFRNDPSNNFSMSHHDLVCMYVCVRGPKQENQKMRP